MSSDIFERIKDECQEYKKRYECIKNSRVTGYAGSYVEIEVIFYVNEHIYLAEKLAGKNLIESFSGFQDSISRTAARQYNTSKLNISVQSKFI